MKTPMGRLVTAAVGMSRKGADGLGASEVLDRVGPSRPTRAWGRGRFVVNLFIERAAEHLVTRWALHIDANRQPHRNHRENTRDDVPRSRRCARSVAGVSITVYGAELRTALGAVRIT